MKANPFGSTSERLLACLKVIQNVTHLATYIKIAEPKLWEQITSSVECAEDPRVVDAPDIGPIRHLNTEAAAKMATTLYMALDLDNIDGFKYINAPKFDEAEFTLRTVTDKSRLFRVTVTEVVEA